MKKLVKIAVIEAIDSITKNELVKALENQGFLVVYDDECPTYLYVVKSIKIQ